MQVWFSPKKVKVLVAITFKGDKQMAMLQKRMSVMSTKINRPGTPTPFAFRAWLGASLKVIETSPTTLAKMINKKSPNGVGNFLRDKNRDITLSAAAEIERQVVKIASDQGRELPEVPCSLPASGGLADV